MKRMEFKTEEREKLVGISEVCEFLSLGQTTVRKMIKEGVIPSYKVANTYRIKPSDLDNFLQKHST